MTPEAVKYLSEQRPGPFHDKLVAHLVSLADQSRSKMKDYYPTWRATDEAFRVRSSINTANKEAVRSEQKAQERGEPGKFALPIAHSQIDTFVSFGYQMFTQRENIFELDGIGLEDVQGAKIAERAIEYDLNKSNFRGAVLLQYLTDIGRYSFGPLKYSWVEKTETVQQDVPLDTNGVDDLPEVAAQQDVEQLVFQGNVIVNTSVYRFLPDPRVPIFRFQEGEFCGDEDFVSYHKLKRLELEQTVAGLEYVDRVTQKSIDNGRDFPFNPTNVYLTQGKNALDAPLILTELQVTLCPDTFLADVDDPAGRALIGRGRAPVKFLFWVLNDSRVVRLERYYNGVNRYGWEVGVLGPDQENFLGLSLYDIVGNLQDVASWLINSRVADIRKHLGLDLVVDESAFNVSDIKERRSIIRLSKSAQGTDIRRYIHQLSRNDTTQSNITDSEVMHQYAKEGTGLTDNLTGQFASGRRSAREASQVFNNAANRVRTAFSCVWFTGLKPLGEGVLANLRVGLTLERILKLTGVPNNPAQTALGVASFTGVTAADIQGNFDFKVFDGTLPSDRQQQAAALQEFLLAGLQNPQIFLIAGLDPAAMLEELFELRGIHNVSRFRLPPERIGQMATLLGLIGGAGNQPGGGGTGETPPQRPNPQRTQSYGGANPQQSAGGQVIAFPQR